MLRNWDPFAELSRLGEEMNRRHALSPASTGAAPAFRPAIDIFEDEESINIHAELAGLKPEDVHVHVESGVLTIHGERKLRKEEKKDGYHRIERSYGAFTRSFGLPENIDSEHVDARLEDGVLDVKLMKKNKPEPRRVAVKG